MERNYNTISPSARTLLLMKGMTSIPYARRAAELMTYPEEYVPDFTGKDFGFLARMAHFESRYRSIDQLLESLAPKNILELSSGFSFRGLHAVNEREVYYIDTDLPELITTKSRFVTTLQNGNFETKGTLETLPLNALDEAQFMQVVDRFPPGEIVIVNEGLLVYLNTEEKNKLFSIIRKVLEKRGGYWITADIYIKKSPDTPVIKFDDKLEQFFNEHKIEENKFESFEAAEAWFNDAGFVVDKEAVADYSKTVAAAHLVKLVPPAQMEGPKKYVKIQTTWQLKIK